MCPSCKAKAQTLEDALSWEIKQIEKSMGEKGHLTASRDVTGVQSKAAIQKGLFHPLADDWLIPLNCSDFEDFSSG